MNAVSVQAPKLPGSADGLQNALAALACLREAAEYEVEVDIADVAPVACDLVDKAPLRVGFGRTQWRPRH